MASGEMSEAEFTAFSPFLAPCWRGTASNGSIHFLCTDWRHAGELIAAGRAAYSDLIRSR
jgi:hypothetical protein